MRAQINESGKLSVIPETSLESFALRVWWEDYVAQKDNQACVRQPFATLHISIVVEKFPDHAGLEV